MKIELKLLNFLNLISLFNSQLLILDYLELFQVF